MNLADLATIRALFDAFADPIFLVDSERRIIRGNKAALSRFGGDITGQDFSLAVRSPQVLAALEAALLGQTPDPVEFTLAEEIVRHFSATLQPLHISEQEGSPRVLVLLHDITAQRRTELLRVDFLTNASHEMKTPLASLLGFIETLQGPAKNDEAARERFLAIMHDQASRMTRLVQDLLSLARIELNEHSPPEGEVNMAPLIRQGLAQLEPRAKERDVALVADLPPAVPAITADEDQMMQVVQNLVENAISYTRPGTEVTVKLETSGHWLRFSVTDHGPGMEAHHLPRLTERFYRADAGRSRAKGGTGLGLAIVKHILNRHQGRLLVESEPGKGSTFSVLLPLKEM